MAKEISERLILHWNYRGYSSLPEELCACGKHICELYLKYNNISELPDWIESMTNLTNIYLQANNLTELPDAIKYLSSLEILDVSLNCLLKLPSAVGELVSLKKLVLTGNKLSTLPESLGNLIDLTSIHISNNNLQGLPYSLHKCRNLREFYADGNQFEVLPNFLTRLPHLKTVSVCSNRFKYLPNLPFLAIENFRCDGNTLLTHLPYPLACQWSRTPLNPLATFNVLHISCYGSFSSRPAQSASVDWGSHFHSGLVLSKEVNHRAPSLCELSLRSIMRHVFELPFVVQHESKSNLHIFSANFRADNGRLVYSLDYDRWVEKLPLPQTLIDTLRSGPQSFCFYCLTALFSYAYAVFVPKVLHVEPPHLLIQPVACSLLFCSPACFEKARQSSVENQSLLNTKLHWE